MIGVWYIYFIATRAWHTLGEAKGEMRCSDWTFVYVRLRYTQGVASGRKGLRKKGTKANAKH